MRIVHVSYYYGVENTGGAAIAATRLHNALVNAGIDSFLFCFKLRSRPEKTVREYPTRGTLRRFLLTIGIKVFRNLWRIIPPYDRLDFNIIPTGILSEIVKLHPDIVHIHWIVSECISFHELERLPCPVVVHLHDLWMLNGFAPYPHQDKRYVDGFTSCNSSYIERWLFDRKRLFVKRKDVVFIGPSQWVKNCADASVIGRGHNNFYVPYFMDSIFSYNPCFRRSHARFIILFGAFGGRSNPVKGFEDLIMAIKLLPEEIKNNIEVHVFGESAMDEKIGETQVRFLGIASSSAELLQFYHSADVFAFPSREETQGQTKLEALFCGLPVIAFNRTACAEGIISGETGYIADDGDIKDFSNGLALYYGKFVSGELEKIRSLISKKTKTLYSNSEIVRKLIGAYKIAIETSKCMEEKNESTIDSCSRIQ